MFFLQGEGEIGWGQGYRGVGDEEKDASNELRARPHEDINLITLLVGAEESGLEVKSQQGGWIPIDAKSKSIVCNIGDMMQLVTRSKLKSTTHRVVDHNIKNSKPRYSMPFSCIHHQRLCLIPLLMIHLNPFQPMNF